MDSLKKSDVKGKRVRVTDDSGCKYVGTVEYVDYQRGKLGITGAVEGSQGTKKSLQIFFRSDIKKIVVFDDNPTVFAQVPTQSSTSKATVAASIKQPSPTYLLMPAGAEYRGGKYKTTTRMVQDNMGSAGETSDNSDKGKTSASPTPSSPSSSESPSTAAGIGAWKPPAGIASSRPRNNDSAVYARVSSDTSLAPAQVLSMPRPKPSIRDNRPKNSLFSSVSDRPRVPVTLSVSRDFRGYPCYIIPTVVTVPNLFIGQKEREFVTGVKNFLWSSVDTPPSIITPRNLYYVEMEGDLYEEAVVRLSTCNKVGLSMEGEVLGRHGKASLLVISSQEDVFVFDLINMGVNAFKWGLYSVLRNKEVVKVIHDSRQVSDTLFHQYGLELENVFDTLAGHVVFSNWLVKRENRMAKPLDLAVKDYLGVPEEHLFSPRYSQSSLKSDTSVWLARPLPHYLLVGAARNSMFLLSLANVIEKAIQMPMEMTIKELMMCSVKSTDEVARQMVLAPQYLPTEVQSSLPVWKRDSYTIRG